MGRLNGTFRGQKEVKKMQEDEELYIINEAGEVKNVLKAGDRILRKKKIEYLEEMVEIKYRYVKFNTQACGFITRNIKYVFILLSTLEYETNVLRHRNGKVINKTKGFATMFNCKEKYARKVLLELRKDDIIHKHKNKELGTYYTFNPFIAHCSKRVTKEVYNDFFNTEWRRYTDEN